MFDPKLVDIIKNGVGEWNAWREEHPAQTVNLHGADLSRLHLTGIHLNSAVLTAANLTATNLEGAGLADARLSRAHLSKTVLCEADLFRADLCAADLRGAHLLGAHLNYAQCCKANFDGAELWGADLSGADFTGATLRGALLEQCRMVKTNLDGADLTACRVFGISAWGISTNGTVQTSLHIAPKDEPTIQVDNLEVAQFIYLLLNNQKIRHVIDTITSKVVLILGRFTAERKVALDAIRDELRRRDYLPVLFDFEKPSSRDITETVSTLAHMARFVIADITDAKSIPQELMAIVPTLPSVPVQPLLLASQREYGMFEHFKRFPWVLEPYLYEDQAELLATITERVIGPAEAKAKEQTGR